MKLKLWDAATGRLIRSFEGHTGLVKSVAFSPDGTHVVSGGEDEMLKLWDVATGQLIWTSKGHSGGVNSVAISPDGTRVLVGNWGGTLELWDAATGRLMLGGEDGSFDDSNNSSGPVVRRAFSPSRPPRPRRP
jgi:WD40 repeat protein